MMTASRRAGLIVAVLFLGLEGGAALALAGPSPQRTVRVRSGDEPNRASSSPQLSSTGQVVAFDSKASNLGPPDPNGAVRDAFIFDQSSGRIASLSSTMDPKGANGASFAPVLSADGQAAAFVSRASNLVADDTNRREDVFLRSSSSLERISVGVNGAQANGDSTEPDVSGDGRFVAFTSTASNLVAGDTNRSSDVFVRDRLRGTTVAVSVSRAGVPVRGASSGAAISQDGRYVAFTSTADRLVRRDSNKVADVFVRDLVAGKTSRVSVSSGGRQQNRAVAKPFSPVSDISRDGRYVVFDSDATSLVRGDRNRSTDVFRHDRKRRTTTRVSLATTGQESDNDSFSPAMSADGRYVTFASFAENLTPDDSPREDVFVRDIKRRQTVMATVSSRGRPRTSERVSQLLQRPSISDDGATVGFVSTARNLVAKDRNKAQDVFLRRLTPAPTAVASPRAQLRGGRLIIAFSSPNRRAGPLLCRLDKQPVAICPLGRALLPKLRDGRHRLVAYPGGPGSWYATRPVKVRITISRGRARIKVTNPFEAFG